MKLFWYLVYLKINEICSMWNDSRSLVAHNGRKRRRNVIFRKSGGGYSIRRHREQNKVSTYGGIRVSWKLLTFKNRSHPEYIHLHRQTISYKPPVRTPQSVQRNCIIKWRKNLQQMGRITKNKLNNDSCKK